jgi:hypothetical protein
MTPRPKHDTRTRHIRLPLDLDRWVEQRAAQADRAYNGQVVYLLKKARQTDRYRRTVMEYKFEFYAYPFDDPAQAEALRARLEAVILAEVEAAGKFMGPLLAEPQEGGDGQEG